MLSKAETFSILQNQLLWNFNGNFSVYPNLHGVKPLSIQKSVTSTI